jgi:hypothetical protein
MPDTAPALALHPIFALPNPERCQRIRADRRLSICLHELGHFLVARKFKAPFAALALPDLGPDVDWNAPAHLPSVVISTKGLSQRAKLGISVAGYAGELCLFDKEYVQAGNEIHVCAAACANDAAAIVKDGRLPVSPGNDPGEIQRVLIGCIQALRFEPYNMLYDDVVGFRRRVTKLHGAWQDHGFRGMAVTGDVLD